jgi:hypothetical protein
MFRHYLTKIICVVLERQEAQRRGFDLPWGKTRANNIGRESSGDDQINRREESL